MAFVLIGLPYHSVALAPSAGSLWYVDQPVSSATLCPSGGMARLTLKGLQS
jgi:hypothetical protein